MPPNWTPPATQEQMAATRAKTIFEEIDAAPVVVHDRPLAEMPKNDPTVVLGKDPKKVYRFVDEDPKHVRRAVSKGYRPVKADGSKLKVPFMHHGRVDGFIGHSGIGLMEADRARVEERKARERPPAPKDLAEAELEAAIDDASSKKMMTRKQADKFRGEFQEHEETVRIAQEESE